MDYFENDFDEIEGWWMDFRYQLEKTQNNPRLCDDEEMR